MNPRQRAYLQLLEFGLVAIRNFAGESNMDLCMIEADHLHNLPFLLDESNEARHRFYILQERSLYLDRLRELGASDYLKGMMNWYHEPWKMLASIAGVELLE